MEQILLRLRQERLKLQEDIFITPPATMEAFQKLFGVWIGLGRAIQIFEEVMEHDRHNDI